LPSIHPIPHLYLRVSQIHTLLLYPGSCRRW
jgi:hypothetical protein